jgi:hypothetical protein
MPARYGGPRPRAAPAGNLKHLPTIYGDERAARAVGLLRAIRAGRQLLHRPSGGTPVAIVRTLLAVQSQDLRAARLALRARGSGFVAADVDAALTEDRILVVAWLARGTLHLVAREDYPWLLALSAPGRLATSRRRLGQEGVAPDAADRAVAVIERALAEHGPLTRAQLGERIAGVGVPATGQALPHLLMLAALRGIAVRGPLTSDGQAFALARDWLGAPARPPDRDAALAELARRWLAAHGPATAADLARWAGLPLRDAHAGLGAIASELRQPGGRLVDLAGAPTARAALAPRLLGAFDPYLLGWQDRSFAVPAEMARRVHPGGGVVRPVATREGQVTGIWSARRRSGRLEIAIDPDDPALHPDAADVARFEGLSA